MAQVVNKTMALIIIGSISLLMASVFVAQAAQEGAKVTTKQVDTDTVNMIRYEGNSVNATNYYHLEYGCPFSDWKKDYGTECQTTVLSVTNSSGDALTVTTDYVVTAQNPTCTGTSAGDIRFVNSTTTQGVMTNATTVTYSYCPSGYLASSWGRTGINTAYGLYAIGALLVAVGMFYGAARESGILGK